MWLLLLLLLSTPAWALTNEEATVLWDKTADATIRYEIRWKHFANNWQWQSVATNLDSTLGTYHQVFAPPFVDSTGDRGACWDMRATSATGTSPWNSEAGNQVCAQIPLATVTTPPPIVIPPPPNTGLVIQSASPSQIIMTWSVRDCSKVTTSTKGSTATVQKRTMTCVP